MAENFNPRPREEGDLPLFFHLNFRNISIHALVKRATKFRKSLSPDEDISIHALVKRATAQSQCTWCRTSYFNPRPREEGDGLGVCMVQARFNFNPRPREEGDSLSAEINRSARFISIHALVKRATTFTLFLPSTTFNFNPRPREEGDQA